MSGALLLLIALALPHDPEVKPDPDAPGTKLTDTTIKKPETGKTAPINADPPEYYEPQPFECRPEGPFADRDDCVTPTDPAEPEPEVTPGDVEREVKRIGLPALTTEIQPAGTTLVNLETIFHTTALPFERTVTVLDSTVDLKATPASYTWHHGDGTTRTTTQPGRPYPAMDVVHQYLKPGQIVASVDANYRVTFRIDGGDWQDLDATITAPGPATALRVREARPVLTQ